MDKISGWLALATLVSYLLSVPQWLPMEISVVLAWVTMFAMWSTLGQTAKRQTIVLCGLGSAALAIGGFNGVAIEWRAMLATNVPLLALFISISFLILANPPESDEQLPTGRKAALTTAIGTNLLGAVINLSVLFVFGDRMKRQNKLTNMQQVLLSRCFSAAAWWSPFFVATGVALLYAPGMQWKDTFLPGMIMAIMALGYTVIEVIRHRSGAFQGYPLKLESLSIPFILAMAVLLLHHLYPQVSIVVLISLLSVAGSLVFMRSRPRLPALTHFISHRLQATGTQFSLFLAAGVFSAGISTLLKINPNLVDFHLYQFGPVMFALLSAIMIVIGLLGIHPFVTISIVSPLLLPLQPNPTSLGFMFLTSWAISTGTAPLSGIGLIMSGRYGATSLGILRNNWHYIVTMWLLASGLNWLLFF